MDGASREERWHVQVVLINTSIRDDEDLATIFYLFNGLVEHCRKFILHGLLGGVYEGKFSDLKLGGFFDFSKTFFVENGAVEFYEVGIFGLSLKDVALWTKMHVK